MMKISTANFWHIFEKNIATGIETISQRILVKLCTHATVPGRNTRSTAQKRAFPSQRLKQPHSDTARRLLR
jgi:hypothetical protein